MPVNFLFRINHKNTIRDGHFNNITWERLSAGPDDNNQIVCRATPSSNKLTRWIIIYRNRNTGIRDEYFKLKFTIQDFEIPIVSHNALLNIKDKINKKTWYVRKDEEIYEVLKKIGASPLDFTSPEFSNYPLIDWP